MLQCDTHNKTIWRCFLPTQRMSDSGLGPLQGHAQKQRLEDQRINKYITRNSCYTTVSSAI